MAEGLPPGQSRDEEGYFLLTNEKKAATYNKAE